jgi:hypothetical protein
MERGEKIVVLISLISILVNAYLVWQTIDIQRELLSIEETALNYESTIVVNTENPVLEQTDFTYHTESIVRTAHSGILNADLEIVTPHYGKIIIRIWEFDVGDSVLIASEMQNEINVSILDSPYEDIVSSGLTQTTAQLNLQAVAYINIGEFASDHTTLLLGTLKLEVELYDLQAKMVVTSTYFGADIMVSVKKAT